MDQQSAKIKFYEQRTFGEKFNASFDFIKSNWKPLLKWVTYFILPVCLIQMVFTLKYMSFSQSLMTMVGDVTSGIDPAYILEEMEWSNYFMLVICQLIGTMFVTSIVYTLMIKYNESEDGRLSAVTFNDLKPTLIKLMGRYLITFFIMIVIIVGSMFICAFLGVTLPFTLFLTLPVSLALAVAVSLLLPVYMFENIGIAEAIGKSFRLGFATWGGVFLMLLIMTIIAGILSTIISLPFSVLAGINNILMASDVSVAGSSGFSMLSYLLGIISLFGYYIAIILVVVGIAYQYAHANEKLNHVSVVEDIDKFENF